MQLKFSIRNGFDVKFAIEQKYLFLV